MIKKFKTLINKPGHLFRYRSFFERKIYFFISKYLHFKTYLLRRFKKDNKFKSFQDGYLKLSPQDLNILGIDTTEIISEIENKLAESKNEINYNKPINILLKSDDFNVESKTFKFISNKNFLSIISNYLEFVPLLTHISFWYSPNKETIENSSQEYHLDHEDIKQVKGFFLIDDVTDDCGPTIFLNSKNSNKIIKKINYKTNDNSKRINDNLINQDYEKEKIICSGEKGTLYLLDTSRCFHCGSRKSIKPRKILAFQFITPFSTSLNWNWKSSEVLNKPFWKNNELSELQKKIVGMN